ATPLMFVGLGVLLAERSGVLFMGVEGAMLLGAFFGFLGAGFIDSAWLGLVFGTVAGLLGASTLILLTVVLPANQVVVGLAFNIVCVGITSFAFRMAAKSVPSMTPVLQAPGWLADLPGAQMLQSVPPLTWLAAGLAVATWYFIFRTAPGLMLRAAGQDRHAALSAGVDVNAVRGIALAAAGALAGLGGAALTVGWIRSFSDDVTLGRGFIALAAVYFGRWYPGWTILACLLFGLGDAMAFRAQGLGGNPHFYLMAPYLLTLLGVAVAGRVRGPQEAGRVQE
ncbi:MAG: ABC transporter permease, partial [Pseudomonadota bacterium]|nr:ABC transporter permease [Pseudomonadota bacterium]